MSEYKAAFGSTEVSGESPKTVTKSNFSGVKVADGGRNLQQGYDKLPAGDGNPTHPVPRNEG